ncbi:AAA family ATPase [Pullulanibacillus sp. KACC 23026]|uniref:AAA family ATPase n=1 Tax=Pullulanibacillus sp. KACC 23026 TaxID=3028315 RepID=UPI0023B083D9|nr:AAA family ATPase [Pullulanibacillus sp. KACC 23026]WEG12040.1 AAA family ATPase [Pullulanibacillus sp. KACC 23026]
MRVTEVHIDQFGQFSDQFFEFPNVPFLVIQGQNESGKTTLIHFIKYMLFGFPSRSTLRSLGFLGDSDIQLGGRLVVWHPTAGRVTIVRHLRKASGEAVLYFPDGSQGDASLLKEWCHGIDLPLFDAIFGLDLDGLKDVHRMKPDTLQHYLFSTGMMGNAKILELERELEKSAQEHFRPLGKNPTMNQTLNELGRIREKLSVWEKKKAYYLSLKKEKEILTDKEKRLKQNQKTLLEKRQQFTEYKAVEPQLIDFQTLNRQMSSYPDNLDSFPHDGRARYESWRTQWVTLEGEKAELELQIHDLEGKIAQLTEQIDSRWAAERDQIQAFIEDMPRLDALLIEIGKIEERLNGEQRAYQIHLNRLEPAYKHHLSEEKILEADTSLQMSHQLTSALKDMQRLEQERDFIERDVAVIEQELHLLDTQSLKDHSLSSEEREAGERLYSLYLRRDARKEEVKRLETDLRQLKDGVKAQKKWKLYSSLALFIGLAALIGWLVGSKMFSPPSWTGWISGYILTLALLVWAGSQLLFKKTSSLEQLEAVQRRLSVLRQETELLKQQESLLQRYMEDQSFQEKEKARIEKRQALLDKRQLSQKEWEEAEALLQTRDNQFRTWLIQKGYPEIHDRSLALEYVNWMEQAKQKIYEIQSLQKTLDKLVKEKEQQDHSLEQLGERLGVSRLSLGDLRLTYENLLEMERKIDQHKQNMEKLREKERSYEEKIARFQKECYNLWQQAQVDSEEAFYTKEALLKKKEADSQELERLNQTLLKALGSPEQLERHQEDFNHLKWQGDWEERFSRELNQIEKNLQELQIDLEDLTVQIRQIEDDQSHAELIHQFELHRNQLNNEAKEWAIYKTALGLLIKAKETYKANRLPALVESAKEYFKLITDGKYIRLYYQETEGFSVEHEDGTLFRAEELSRGTAEQLYVSLRLALVDLFETRVALPLIVDDGFVNFDQGRLNQMMVVLEKVAKNRQVLLFTCHSYESTSIRMEDWKEKGRKVAN